MKVLTIVLLALSVPFLILSMVYGIEAGSLRSSSWGQGDAAFQAARQKQQTLHLIVMAFSIPYFLVALGTFVASGLLSRGKGWRIVGFVAGFLALVMVVWTLMLSGAVSYDEVFPAWLVAGVLFGVLGILSLTRRQDLPPEPPPQERPRPRRRPDPRNRPRRRPE